MLPIFLGPAIPDEYQATSFWVSWSSNMCSFSMVYMVLAISLYSPHRSSPFPILKKASSHVAQPSVVRCIHFINLNCWLYNNLIHCWCIKVLVLALTDV